jgi:hypothetical protein
MHALISYPASANCRRLRSEPSQVEASAPPPSLVELKDFGSRLKEACEAEEQRAEAALRAARAQAAAEGLGTKAGRLRALVSASREGPLPAMPEPPTPSGRRAGSGGGAAAPLDAPVSILAAASLHPPPSPLLPRPGSSHKLLLGGSGKGLVAALPAAPAAAGVGSILAAVGSAAAQPPLSARRRPAASITASLEVEIEATRGGVAAILARHNCAPAQEAASGRQPPRGDAEPARPATPSGRAGG